jgi:hypothetical protein
MKRAVRAAKYIAICGVVTAGGIGACSSDDSSTPNTNNTPADGGTDTGTVSTTSMDSGKDTSVVVSSSPDSSTADTGTISTGSGGDAGSGDTGAPDSATDSATADAGSTEDAAPTPSFCQSQAGLAFCDDFDLADSLELDGGAAVAWSSLVGTPQEVAISSAQSASAPSSLLVQLVDGDGGPGTGDQSAKVVKMITPTNGVSQAIYEFDIYIASYPLANVGGFATDFQFDDTAGGSDQFGFRIGVFANTTGFDHADLEHNHPVLGGSDDITPSIPITAGAWNHVKMVVAYSATGNDGGNGVAFQLYVNQNATAAVDAIYPAPFAAAPFARFAAGMVYAFDGVNKDWGIYYDNFTLKLQ